MFWIYILVMVWIHSGFVNFMLVIFRLCTGYVQVIFWIYSGYGLDIFRLWFNFVRFMLVIFRILVRIC